MLLIVAIVYRVVVDRNKKRYLKEYNSGENESDLEEEQENYNNDEDEDDDYYDRNEYVY